MPGSLSLEFVPFGRPAKDVLVVFCEEGLKFGAAARKAIAPVGDLVERAAAADRFKGKNGATLDIVAPTGLEGVSRLVVVGVGKARGLKHEDFVKLGGVAMGKVPSSAGQATVIADLGDEKPDQAADIALGMRLRAYTFDRYKTKRKEGDDLPADIAIAIAVESVAAVRKAYAARDAVANGVTLARDLINEPANVLYPEEFARARAGAQEARRQCRGARRRRDEEARHECASRRRPGLGA